MVNDDNKVTYFAQSDSRNKRVAFGIKRKDRSRHMYVIGKTGMGKSTLLENMAIQDIQNGEGLAFIDPHGKTAELLLEYVPESRMKDVLYFAPFDMENPISFNVMEDVGPDRRHLVVNGLMSTFEKIWVDAWSARMAYILNNTLLALLEYPGSTLLGINRMLSDKEYRKKIVENIKDPSVRSFWVDEFGKYTDKYAAEATPAIQNKVGQFTSNPLIRNIIGQSGSSFDMRKIMDEKKIMIVNLSKGRVGEGNANLLGSMLITKMYLAAMSRADASESTLHKLPNFYLYVDEFQSFANKSFADILSEARKYKLNLTIAHQYIEQMEEEVRAAVFGNVGTMVTFRVGAYDADVLEKEFAPQFTAEDLVNLGVYQIYLKLMIDGVGSAPFSATTMSPIEKPTVSYKDQVIEWSRKQFAAPREKVEEEIKAFHQPSTPAVAKKTDKPEIKKPEAEKAPIEKFVHKEAPTPHVPAPAHVTIKPPVAPVKLVVPQKISYVVTPEKKETIVPEKIAGERGPEKREERNEVRREEKRNDFVAPKIQPVSLSHLKTPNIQNKQKNPNPENLSELKKALSELLKNNETEKAKSNVAPTPNANPNPDPALQEKVNKPEDGMKPPPRRNDFSASLPPKKPREIPEDVLKTVLQTDK